MRIEVEHLAGTRAGESRSFAQERVRLGRAADNDLVFDPDRELSVSGHHCELFWAAGALHLRDLGSQNGTFVNGERIAGPTPLRSGDEVGLGREGPLLRVEISEPPPGVASSDPTLRGRAPVAGRVRRRVVSVGVGVLIGLAVAAAILVWWWSG